MVLAGKNERLLEEIEKLDTGDSTVKSYGFVSNVRDMMAVSDLLVTRASPHTLSESMAAGLPMILLRPTVGVEDRYADHLLWLNAAMKAHGEQELLFHLSELLKNPRRLREMKDAIRPHRRANAAMSVVERLSRIVK